MKRIGILLLIFVFPMAMLCACGEAGVLKQTPENGQSEQSSTEISSAQGVQSEEVSDGVTNVESVTTSSAATNSDGGSSKAKVSETNSGEASSKEISKLNSVATIEVGETYTARISTTGEWKCSILPSTGINVTSEYRSPLSGADEEIFFEFSAKTPGDYTAILKRANPSAEITISFTVIPAEPIIPTELTSQTMTVGQSYSVRLGRPTGGDWYDTISPSIGIEVSSDSRGPRTLSNRFIEPEPGHFREDQPIGNGGYRIFTFFAKTPGDYTVHMEMFLGSLKTKSSAEKTFTITVTE